MGKRRRERVLEEWRERVEMDTRVGQVPGQGGTGSLRVPAGGQGERQEEQGEGRWSQREGQCQTQDQRDPWSEAGQVRWRPRAAAPGIGSSWTRRAPGGLRQEAEEPEGLGCGPKRDAGGPVTWGR